MDISASATPATTYAAATDAGRLNQNFDQFLLLLTTQLKNQDPLSPMDSTQFTNQLVSFSGVEQQIKMNSSLEKLLAVSATAQTTLGLSYIGLNVDTQGGDFKYYGSGGVAKTSYELPAGASVCKISILDDDNNLVYAQDGELSAGRHEFVWDGKDQNGEVAPAGTYHLRVGALDNDQKTLAVTTVPGIVEGIQKEDDGSISLIINGREVPMSDIRKATL